MLSISATAGSCPVIARSRRQSACLATHRLAACRAKVVRWTCRRPGNRCPKWRRKWACRPRSVSRPRNSPPISTATTSLSARTGAGPRWPSRHSRHRSRTRSPTTQNTRMMRVSRSMAAAHEAALPQTNRRRAPESYATSTARKNLHIGLAGTRREVALELRELAEDFERSDGAALSRDRIVCRVAVAAVTVVAPTLPITGGDWRYPGSFWAAIAGLAWGVAYAFSSRRQHRRVGRLEALAARWLGGEPPGAGMTRIMTRLQQ